MDDFNKQMDDELNRAVSIHGGFNSLHEGIAVIREEYLELEAEIFKKKPEAERVKSEALQVAAMCKMMFQFVDEMGHKKAEGICRNCSWNDTPELNYSTCLLSSDTGDWTNYGQDYGCNEFTENKNILK